MHAYRQDAAWRARATADAYQWHIPSAPGCLRDEPAMPMRTNSAAARSRRREACASASMSAQSRAPSRYRSRPLHDNDIVHEGRHREEIRDRLFGPPPSAGRRESARRRSPTAGSAMTASPNQFGETTSRRSILGHAVMMRRFAGRLSIAPSAMHPEPQMRVPPHIHLQHVGAALRELANRVRAVVVRRWHGTVVDQTVAAPREAATRTPGSPARRCAAPGPPAPMSSRRDG